MVVQSHPVKSIKKKSLSHNFARCFQNDRFLWHTYCVYCILAPLSLCVSVSLIPPTAHTHYILVMHLIMAHRAPPPSQPHPTPLPSFCFGMPAQRSLYSYDWALSLRSCVCVARLDTQMKSKKRMGESERERLLQLADPESTFGISGFLFLPVVRYEKRLEAPSDRHALMVLLEREEDHHLWDRRRCCCCYSARFWFERGHYQ